MIPLSHPIQAADGSVVDRVFVAKGTTVRIPIASINRSEAVWGPDVATFDPARWLFSEEERLNGKKAEVLGYKNLLTFASGPRMCLGRNFALLEFKVRVFVFLSRGGFCVTDRREFLCYIGGVDRLDS